MAEPSNRQNGNDVSADPHPLQNSAVEAIKREAVRLFAVILFVLIFLVKECEKKSKVVLRCCLIFIDANGLFNTLTPSADLYVSVCFSPSRVSLSLPLQGRNVDWIHDSVMCGLVAVRCCCVAPTERET